MADDDIDFDPYDIDDADEDEIPSEAEVEARLREEAAFDDWRALKLAIRRANLVRMAEPTSPPFMLGRYEALETVEGGMGIVVIGRDPDLDRKVAIKLWKDEGLVAETALRAEAQTLAKLNHPNVVSVYD